MRRLWMAAMVLWASTAQAETTNCVRTASGVSCETTGSALPRPSASPDVAPANAAAASCAKKASAFEFFVGGSNGVQRRCNRDAASLKGEVGDLLSQGDCDGAVKLALSTGDIGYAREVKDFCAAPGPQAAP